MKTLLSISFIFVFSCISMAQVIDDSSVDQAQSGYNFVEGQFVAYLADTVTPGFVERKFQDLNIQILDIQIEPLTISIVNQPSETSIDSLRAHPQVLSMHTIVDKTSMERTLKALKDNGWTEEQIDEARSDAAPMEMYFIQFDYPVNERKVKIIMGEYRDVAYKFLPVPYRTVTLKAKEGEEPTLMNKVEQLPFVEGTAMIAGPPE